jgi:hypothetical protein
MELIHHSFYRSKAVIWLLLLIKSYLKKSRDTVISVVPVVHEVAVAAHEQVAAGEQPDEEVKRRALK